MNSRRTLLMIGVPDLDDRAFVRHGRNILPQMGGGGKAPKQPTHTTQTVNNVPAFIQPYIESMLGRAQALGTDAQYEPFDPSQRFEGTTELQQQSYDSAANMGTNPLLDLAGNWAQSGMMQAGQASQYADPLMNQALNFGGAAAGMGQQYNQAVTDPSQVGNFMSPYMQNVVDVQKNEAIRDYQSQLPSMQAAATNAGAFGGSRHAILEAEGQRNLNQNLSDIQARGSQSAYDQAMQSMQFGSNLGMQGYQTGLQGVGQGINAAQLGLAGSNAMLQGAGTLGQIGQTQYNQQMGITELQNAMGTQQQQQGQQQRDFNYQQFLDELNFPYQQLGFMSDMTRGLPLSQSTVYQNNAQPNSTSQLIGGGLAAYGLLNRAKGGVIPKPKKKYAQGGQVDGGAFSGMDVDETTATLESLSDEQLAQYASTVQDAVTLSLIRAEAERRARLRQQPGQMPQTTVAQDVAQQAAPAGIAAMMPQQQMQPQQVPPEQMMRSGGIVALANGGTPRDQIGLRDMYGRVREGLPRVIEDQFGRYIPDWARSAHDKFGGVNRIRRNREESLRQNAPELPTAQGTLNGPAFRAEAAIPGIAGQAYPAQGAPEVATVDLTPEQEAAEATRQQEIYGPLEESVARGASQPPAPVQGGGTRGQGPAAEVAQQLAVDQATAGAPKSFEEYLTTVDERATQSLEEKMLVDALRSGLDERQARVVAQDNRGKMDALIAAGAAMMQGTSVTDGLARGAGAGVEALRDANETQLKLEEGLARAQEEQSKYELALRKDNQKEARDTYNNWMIYDQKNTQFAAELKLKQAALAQEYALGSQRNAIAASRAASGIGPDGLDYRAVAAAETRIAALPETAAYESLGNPVMAGAMTPEERSTVEDNYNLARKRVYQQMGIPMIDSGGSGSGGAGGAWSIVE